jgi:hypothetical protein
VWDLQDAGGGWTGTMDAQTGRSELNDIKVSGDTFAFAARVNSPMGSLNLTFTGTVMGDQITGTCKTMFGNSQFTGTRA